MFLLCFTFIMEYAVIAILNMIFLQFFYFLILLEQLALAMIYTNGK